MPDFSNFFRKAQEVASQVGEAAKAAGEQASQAAQQAYETVAPTVEEAAKSAGAAAQQAYSSAEKTAGEAFDYVKEQVAGSGVSLPLDEVGRKIASLGAPAIAFAVAASVAGGMGLAGGAVVTTALAMLGGPAGMVGGLIALGVLTVIADAVGKYGIEALLVAVYRARIEQGMSVEQARSDIDGQWLSNEVKHKIKSQLGG
jgi:hypothetical protein